jgi:hypothetical protein
VPGLIMLALFTESLANASFGIFFPKFIGPSTRSCPPPSPTPRSSWPTSAPPPPSPWCSAS